MLKEPAILTHLLSRFPYDNDNALAPTDDDDDLSIEESEASKAGLRALSKERWDTLQAEYAEYRENLLCRIAAAAASTPAPTPNNMKSVDNTPDESSPPATKPKSYPPGCVLFTRHVPPDTNKTALRARFPTLLAIRAHSTMSTIPRASIACVPSSFLRLSMFFFADFLLAVLFAPDDARARAGAAGS